MSPCIIFESLECTSIARVTWLGTKNIVTVLSRMPTLFADMPAPRCIQIQYHCKHVQVVWALLQYFLLRVKCTLAIDVMFLLSFKNYTRGHPGSPGTSWTAAECSTTELYNLHVHAVILLNTYAAGLWAQLEYFFAVREVPGLNPGVPLYNFWKTRQKWHRSRETLDWNKKCCNSAHTTCTLCSTYWITSAGIQLSCLSMLQYAVREVPRDRCHFSLVFQKLYKGTPAFKPGTSRTAEQMLYHWAIPRCIHIQ